MSNRKKEVQTGSSNPAQIFLEWSSTNKCFSYWDKKAQEEKLIQLPFTFLYLAERTTVKGFDKIAKKGIYANEVKFLSEQLIVKNFKSEEIATGIWSEISAKVDQRGGKFCKSIYCMTRKGTLINIQLYGASVGEWFEFTKKTKSRLTDEWVTVECVEEKKNGANTYYVPVFKFNKSLTNEESELADEAYILFEQYETEPSPRVQEVHTEEHATEMTETDSDIPF